MSRFCLFLLTFIAVFAIGLGPTRAADVKLFPDNTEVVISIRLKQIAASELIASEKGALDQPRAMLDRLAADQPILACLHDLGIDPFRDLTCIRLAGARGKEFKATFLVVEGDFAALKLNGKLSAATGPGKVKIDTSGRVTVYEIGATGAKHQFAALINPTALIVVPSASALTDTLARQDGSKKTSLPKGLSALIEAGNDKESIGVVATGNAVSLLMENLTVPKVESAIAAVKSLEAVSATITLTRDIEAQVGVYARDDATARQLADAAVSAIATVRHLADQHAGKDKNMQPV